MAAQRHTAPAIQHTTRQKDGVAAPGLTRAEAHALRRTEPLTPSQFKELRVLAEHGVNPLRRM